jgi:mono/diheme cytochrome c family protein
MGVSIIKKWLCTVNKAIPGLLVTLCIAPQLAVADSSAALIQQPVFSCGSGLDKKISAKDKTFESVPAKPLALSDDGSLLFVINSPANCLEIYRTADNKLTLASSIAVGVDPVAVAVRSASEVWVVNHISDSVSIVNIDGQPHIEQTLQVGDEPWDIVFANSDKNRNATVNNRDRAFISAAFRGQNHPQFKEQYLLMNRLDTASGEKGELIGRADLWAFDIDNNRQPKLAGIINTFTVSLRSLAVDRSGNRVFATAFKSGNRTAITPISPDKIIGEKWSADGVAQPEPFAIVQQQKDGRWLDAAGNAWPDFINYDISDNDLFVIDATASLKVGNPDHPIFNRQAIAQTVEGIGSVLFNSSFDDEKNRLLITSVDADNITPTEAKLKSVFVSNNLHVIDFNQTPAKVSTVDLDKLLAGDKQKPGFALPSGLQINPTDGSVVITSMGTNQLASFDVDAALNAVKNNDAAKNSGLQKFQTALGPIAIIPAPASAGAGQQFYSYNYIGSSVAIVKKSAQGFNNQFTENLFDPELANIKNGRRFLYDATVTSNNNRVACASCHIFGGSDNLQWVLHKDGKNVLLNRVPFIEHDGLKTTVRAIVFKRDPAASKVGDSVPLGDSQFPIKYIGDQAGFADRIDSGEIRLEEPGFVYLTEGALDNRLTRFKILSGKATWALIDAPYLHPHKGPMRTTPLFGIGDSGSMHFLGDRTGLVVNKTGPCSNRNETPEQRAFKEFNSPCDGGDGTFQALQGGERLSAKDMDDLTAFSLALMFPPNPIRPLDNQINVKGERIFRQQKVGADLANWNSVVAKGPLLFSCADCHTVDRHQNQFGTSKMMYSAPPLSIQDAKVPHLRFLYDRAGFLRGDYRNSSEFLNMRRNDKHFDTIVHAQGLNHGGWFDFTMFFANYVWILNPEDATASNAESKERYFNLFSYLMEFDTNYFPMYGKQITISENDLKTGKFSPEVTAYLDNALHSKSNFNEMQCEVDVYGLGSTKKTFIRTTNDLIRVGKLATTPLTLTCL